MFAEQVRVMIKERLILQGRGIASTIQSAHAPSTSSLYTVKWGANNHIVPSCCESSLYTGCDHFYGFAQGCGSGRHLCSGVMVSPKPRFYTLDMTRGSIGHSVLESGAQLLTPHMA
ncbi:hypothetical protein N1851_018282 [Merluccius polli]|uniref:Uncharacterized protein n=1 Tax=Merluccius polli TaxID=89951 RepID=A0AA47MNK6_MERPO|nr:hypothetical protein N1851_018282 [Merluccius polli]